MQSADLHFLQAAAGSEESSEGLELKKIRQDQAAEVGEVGSRGVQR
jgi:hypothetical protein